MMRDDEFDGRLKIIQDQAAARQESVDAYLDQELARLFNESEWTQEKIGRRMGKSKAWVSYRLVFGRFLNSFTTCERPENLTEGRFRTAFAKTRGDEAERFKQTLEQLKGNVPAGYKNMVSKPGTRKAILDECGDGQWYTAAQIHASVEGVLGAAMEGEAGARACRAALGGLQHKPPAGVTVESKSIGKKSQYRIVKVDPENAPRDATAFKLHQQIKPIIDELFQWSKQHQLMQSPSTLKQLAIKLERIFRPYLEGAKQRV